MTQEVQVIITLDVDTTITNKQLQHDIAELLNYTCNPKLVSLFKVEVKEEKDIYKMNDMTQEEIEGNNTIAAYMQEATKDYLTWKQSDIPKLVTKFEYCTSMDWLYLVYQKITDWFNMENDLELDTYTRMKLHEQHLMTVNYISGGYHIKEIFKSIVEWIKIYNLKVLEDEK